MRQRTVHSPSRSGRVVEEQRDFTKGNSPKTEDMERMRLVRVGNLASAVWAPSFQGHITREGPKTATRQKVDNAQQPQSQGVRDLSKNYLAKVGGSKK